MRDLAAELRAATERLLGPVDWDAPTPDEPYDGPTPDQWTEYEFEVIR